MLLRLLKNDLKNSKLASIAIFAFILFSSCLFSTSGILTTNLMGSIDEIMLQAKTPHFVQMHMGEINEDTIASFAKEEGQVKDYQVLPFLNIDSSQIYINDTIFEDSSQDNGFSYQSEKFDYLLDLDNQRIQVEPGQIYIPLSYFLNGSIKTNDHIRIGKRNFLVKGPLRDSQMNSTLASSKRFLIHKEDYKELLPLGRQEYLIEFLLENPDNSSLFQESYTSHSLPSNGPTITYALFRLINSINDGIMIAIFLLLSILSLLVCFLSIRLTLLAKIEEDYVEIGVLKALGFRTSKIKKIYHGKYFFLTLLGLLFGYIFSLFLSKKLLKGIQLAMGPSPHGYIGLMVGLISCIILFIIISFYIQILLNRFTKISPAQAISLGPKEEDSKLSNHFKLRNQNRIPLDFYLGIKSVLSRKKLHFSLFLILIVSTFIFILPKSLSYTLSDGSFIPYMGIGSSDLMITLQDSKDLEGQIKTIEDKVKNDPAIDQYVSFQRKSFETKWTNNQIGRIQTELGNHQLFPVKYLEGRPPIEENEIALSKLQAEELERKIGDTLEIKVDQHWLSLKICGLYSDITNGGKTSKATFEDSSSPSLSTTYCLSLRNRSTLKNTLEDYKTSFPTSRVYDIKEYRDEVFGSTLASVDKVSQASMVLACGLIFFISLLFSKMLLIKDRKTTSILKATGFSQRQILNQYYIGSVFVAFTSLLVGLILVQTLGKGLASLFLSTFGIENLHLLFHPIYTWIAAPILLFILTLLATGISSKPIARMKIADSIKE